MLQNYTPFHTIRRKVIKTESYHPVQLDLGILAQELLLSRVRACLEEGFEVQFECRLNDT